MMLSDGGSRKKTWFMEGLLTDGRTWLIPLEPLPYRVGRMPDCQLTLTSTRISRYHAIIYEDDGGLWIQDLNSTNGTHVNEERISGPFPLRDRDLIRLGDLEFRVGVRKDLTELEETQMSACVVEGSPKPLPRGERQFAEMIENEAVTVCFQTIVRMSDGKTVAYEVTGRGNHEGLPTSPVELFQVAESLGRAAELSRLFRTVGIRQGVLLPGKPALFVNIHPSEIQMSTLPESLRRLRLECPRTPLALELSERAVVDPGKMRWLRDHLDKLNIRLAYDDFGAGQARFQELVQVPPDIMKFDISLVRSLVEERGRGRKVVETLVKMCRDLGITPLAEGVEDVTLDRACREVGFGYGQGYYYHRPLPLEPLLGETEA